MDVQILQGHKVIEIKNAGISKGDAGIYFLSKDQFNFICAIGDDWTDEDLFKVLPENSWTLRVGLVQSNAKFNLKNQIEVIKLLKEMVEVTNENKN